MQIIGHRGARAVSPQNTLPSFEIALRERVPMIELDTQLTSDGRVIIFHDDEVGQITRGAAHGSVNSFSLDEIRKLNVHDGFEDGKTYQVPTLEEVFDLVDKFAEQNGFRTKINVELKGSNTAEPVSEIIKQYLANGWKPQDFIISSFRHDELEKFKQLMPDIEIAVLLDKGQFAEMGVEQSLSLAERLGAVAVNPDKDFTTPEFVQAIHAKGLETNVYTVNTPEDIKRMEELGIDRIFTDDSAKAKEVLGKVY